MPGSDFQDLFQQHFRKLALYMVMPIASLKSPVMHFRVYSGTQALGAY